MGVFARRAATSIAVLAFGFSASAATAAVTGPDLVTNGGFEAALTGWTPTAFFAEGFDYGIDGDAHGGANAFYGGAIGALGFLSQTLATAPGRTYQLSLWRSSNGFLPNEFTVTAGGKLLQDEADLLLQGYALETFDFVATAATTTLQFGFQDDSGLIHLDDVSVRVVPEPETIGLFGVGAGAWAWRRKRGQCSLMRGSVRRVISRASVSSATFQ